MVGADKLLEESQRPLSQDGEDGVGKGGKEG